MSLSVIEIEQDSRLAFHSRHDNVAGNDGGGAGGAYHSNDRNQEKSKSRDAR